MNDKHTENIELTLPVNAAYVSSVRLTASSISNRMRFDIDEIEDIKAAVSEACAFIIKLSVPDVHTQFKISFILRADTIKITFFIDNMDPPENVSEEMGLVMIKALMNELEVKAERGGMLIAMVKAHTSDGKL